MQCSMPRIHTSSPRFSHVIAALDLLRHATLWSAIQHLHTPCLVAQNAAADSLPKQSMPCMTAQAQVQGRSQHPSTGHDALQVYHHVTTPTCCCKMRSECTIISQYPPAVQQLNPCKHVNALPSCAGSSSRPRSTPRTGRHMPSLACGQSALRHSM